MNRNLLAWAVQVPIFGALWLLLAGGIDPYEALAALIFGAVASGLATFVAAAGLARFRPRARWLGELARLPFSVARGSLQVAGSILRWRAGSHLGSTPFDPGGDDDRSKNRRAAAALLGTVAPDAVVVEIDREERLLRYHRLAPGAAPGTAERLSKP